MRNHLDTSSAAQYLDGTRLTGRLQIPVNRYLDRHPATQEPDGTFSNRTLKLFDVAPYRSLLRPALITYVCSIAEASKQFCWMI
jgi:hypothetical protein